MTAKFSSKKRWSDSTSAPSSRDTKQTVPWPRASTPVTTASGARRRQWSSITPSCYTLRQKGTARIADDAQPKRTRKHLTACTGYNSLPLRLSRVGRAGTVKPANRGAREGHESSPQNPWRKQRTPHPAPGKRATKGHSMEYPKRPAEAEARMKSAFIISKTHFGCPEELHWAPNKFWRTRATTQEGWQNWTGPPNYKKLSGHRNNSGEREGPTLQNKKALRTELQSFKGRDGQSLARRRGRIHAMWKGRCLEQRPYRYDKNRSLDLTPGRGVRQRIWGTLNLR